MLELQNCDKGTLRCSIPRPTVAVRPESPTLEVMSRETRTEMGGRLRLGRYIWQRSTSPQRAYGDCQTLRLGECLTPRWPVPTHEDDSFSCNKTTNNSLASVPIINKSEDKIPTPSRKPSNTSTLARESTYSEHSYEPKETRQSYLLPTFKKREPQIYTCMPMLPYVNSYRKKYTSDSHLCSPSRTFPSTITSRYMDNLGCSQYYTQTSAFIGSNLQAGLFPFHRYINGLRENSYKSLNLDYMSQLSRRKTPYHPVSCSCFAPPQKSQSAEKFRRSPTKKPIARSNSSRSPEYFQSNSPRGQNRRNGPSSVRPKQSPQKPQTRQLPTGLKKNMKSPNHVQFPTRRMPQQSSSQGQCPTRRMPQQYTSQAQYPTRIMPQQYTRQGQYPTRRMPQQSPSPGQRKNTRSSTRERPKTRQKNRPYYDSIKVPYQVVIGESSRQNKHEPEWSSVSTGIIKKKKKKRKDSVKIIVDSHRKVDFAEKEWCRPDFSFSRKFDILTYSRCPQCCKLYSSICRDSEYPFCPKSPHDSNWPCKKVTLDADGESHLSERTLSPFSLNVF